MRHFASRLKNERFVIHDVKRKIAGMYNGHEWIMNYVGEAEVYLSEYERAFENLWKKYYLAVNIEERPHEKQMKRSMPVRYWKFLPQKNLRYFYFLCPIVLFGLITDSVEVKRRRSFLSFTPKLAFFDRIPIRRCSRKVNII